MNLFGEDMFTLVLVLVVLVSVCAEINRELGFAGVSPKKWFDMVSVYWSFENVWLL